MQRYPFFTKESGESGQGLVEYALILILLVSGFTCLAFALFSRPDLLDKGAIIAVIGALLGGIAWAGKQTLHAATNRAQLRILESLAAKTSLTRAEIRTLLAKDYFIFKLLPQIDDDALTNLVLTDKVRVVGDGVYGLPSTETKVPFNST